jgi:hypothetical protein
MKDDVPDFEMRLFVGSLSSWVLEGWYSWINSQISETEICSKVSLFLSVNSSKGKTMFLKSSGFRTSANLQAMFFKVCWCSG